MKSILTTTALVFSVGLLAGCGGNSTKLSVDGVADLTECTEDQKGALDTISGGGGDENVDLGGKRGTNDPVSDTAQLWCANTKDKAAFETIRDKELAEGDNRADCKWLYDDTDVGSRQDNVDNPTLFYCRGEVAAAVTTTT